MAFGYTVKELIESVKTRCLIPISQQTFSEEDILRFANEEIDLKMVPNIIRVKEEFYVKSDLFDVGNESNQKFEIPYRAVGSKLRNVQYINSGNTHVMSRIQPEEVPFYEYGAADNRESVFYLEGNYVVLPTRFPSAGGQVKLSYYLAPNDLVLESRIGIISDIDRVGDGTVGSITLSNVSFPTNFTAAGLVDFLQVKPGFRTYSYDVSIQTVNPTTNQIFFNLEDIPADLKVGDHLASAGECMIPQIPVELHSMLAQSIACRVLEAMGDNDNLSRANEKLKEMEDMLFNVIDQRTEGNPQKINNIRGPIRRAKLNYKYNGGYGR